MVFFTGGFPALGIGEKSNDVEHGEIRSLAAGSLRRGNLCVELCRRTIGPGGLTIRYQQVPPADLQIDARLAGILQRHGLLADRARRRKTPAGRKHFRDGLAVQSDFTRKLADVLNALALLAGFLNLFRDRGGFGQLLRREGQSEKERGRYRDSTHDRLRVIDSNSLIRNERGTNALVPHRALVRGEAIKPRKEVNKKPSLG
jgi:hypothetical protein